MYCSLILLCELYKVYLTIELNTIKTRWLVLYLCML